jgi:hypothetical protein
MWENEVLPSETVSRYLFEGNIRSSDNTIRHSAFIPPSSLKLSVFRIYDLADNDIWNLAVEKVEPYRKEAGTVIGRGDLLVSTVIQENLRVIPDSAPSRHADVCGWPDDRDERVTIAKVLAAKASPPKKRPAETS